VWAKFSDLEHQKRDRNEEIMSGDAKKSAELMGIEEGGADKKRDPTRDFQLLEKLGEGYVSCFSIPCNERIVPQHTSHHRDILSRS
jgi:hypothetical protein